MKVKHKKTQVPITELNACTTQKKNIQILWSVWLCVILIIGMLRSIRATWGTLAPSDAAVTLAACLVLGCCALSENIREKTSLGWICMLIPWPVVLVFTGMTSCWTGARAWFNVLIARWNAVNEGGAALFSIQADKADVFAFLMLLTVLISEITWFLVRGRHLILLSLLCAILLLLQLLCVVLNPVACGVMFSGLGAVWITGKDMRITRRGVIWSLGILGIMCFMGNMMPTAEITAVDDIRETIQKQIHEMRYGKDTLPEGDLYAANELQADSEEMIKLRTEQIKNLYLKGFVGASYSNGVWSPLSGSAYGGKYAGMLSWLSEQGFDPLTQVSEYYKYDDSDEITKNRLNIEVSGASRYYVYTPATLQDVVSPKMSENKDTRLMSKGIKGTPSYIMDEMSGSRPAELTVTADWVSDPQTEEQKAYLEAEATYRSFVYDSYLDVDADTAELMQKMFWDDYESESDGIYSAICQIRNVLKENVEYTENPEVIPEDEDPVQYFLTESKSGNSMLYASVAVDALRVHGIPARYVEGYYVASSDMGANGKAEFSLSGQDAHAWVEAYFDGIGWLPLDVSPGYYYDAVTLQKMVSSPDTVQQNAVLKNNAPGSEQVTGLDGTQKQKLHEKIIPVMYDIMAISLGIVAILVMLLVLIIVLSEVIRAICLWKSQKKERNASCRERTILTEKKIYTYLGMMGIEARLGWNTKETDKQLTERFAQIEPGEYNRVCELIEKVIYGEIELEPYEERTLRNFLEKMTSDTQKMGWKMWLKRRYTYVWKTRR